jgi:hypothetical protein
VTSTTRCQRSVRRLSTPSLDDLADVEYDSAITIAAPGLASSKRLRRTRVRGSLILSLTMGFTVSSAKSSQVKFTEPLGSCTLVMHSMTVSPTVDLCKQLGTCTASRAA